MAKEVRIGKRIGAYTEKVRETFITEMQERYPALTADSVRRLMQVKAVSLYMDEIYYLGQVHAHVLLSDALETTLYMLDEQEIDND